MTWTMAMDRPLEAVTPQEEAVADEILEQARALVEAYGVRAMTRLVRARRAGPAIVEEAERRNAELIVMGAPRRPARRRTAIFGPTVDYVLKASPCRVLLTAGRRAA
jgi:nucleotide-binding universal stress UspA family protein